MFLSEFLKELNIPEEDCKVTTNEDMQIMDEMASVRGRSCEIDDIDFSFYFSNKNSNHSIRIKVLWNREKMTRDVDGYIELHGGYKYVISPHAQYKPRSWEINGLRYFCKKYKVLFSAVWENKLEEEDVSDYFKGRIILKELLTMFENISEKDFYYVNHCNSLRELEECVRKYHIFNMND